MANNEPKETNLWFLDILEDDESKGTEDILTENGNFEDTSDSGIFISENIQNDDLQLKKETNYVESESINSKGDQDAIIEDEISLKSEVEKSLFDLAKESVQKSKDPQNDKANSEETGEDDDFERLLFRNDDQTRQENTTEKPLETYEKSIDIGTTGNQQVTESSNNDFVKPKIYVILKSNRCSDSKSNIAQSNAKLSDVVCSEIGNTEINLNDFISPQSKPVTGKENISTSVNVLGEDGDKRKVELVITIKDERNKAIEKPASSNTYKNEINTDFPNLDSLLNNEFLDSQIKRLSERTQQLAQRANALVNNDTWQTAKVSGDRNTQYSWSDSKDTYFRESDGARCYRTVKNTPWGRQVQTHCYKENHLGSRRRNYGWSSGVSSFFGDLESDFDRMFNRFNRLMFY